MAPKTRNDGLLDNFCTLIVDHQIGISVNLLLLLSLTHLCFPRARQSTRPFFELSYHEPDSNTYTQGWNDVYFVAFWVVVFTGLRAVTMEYLIRPLAMMGGVNKKKAIVRFQEQAWMLLYYVIFWSLGMYLMYNSKYWFNLRELWTNFPTRAMSGTMKWYYLVQLAFWLQQILVVNVEEKRKDYAQMFTHHIITSALVIFSYAYYQTKVGNTILCLMDIVDILLPAAKLLRYLEYRTACDVAFGVFIVTWFFTRHVFYLLVCWSIYAHVPTTMPYGCYNTSTGAKISASDKNWPSDGGNQVLSNIFQSFQESKGVVCFNPLIQNGFLSLLLALEGLMLLWFSMMVRVAWKVVQGQSAEDSRSDDEDSGDEVDTESNLEKKVQTDMTACTGRSLAASSHPNAQANTNGLPFEEEVGVEGLHLGRRRSPGVSVRRTAAGSGGRAHGMSTTRDRKELLGRIGCDGPS